MELGSLAARSTSTKKTRGKEEILDIQSFRRQRMSNVEQVEDGQTLGQIAYEAFHFAIAGESAFVYAMKWNELDKSSHDTWEKVGISVAEAIVKAEA